MRSVSYTHLDVYKRQEFELIRSGRGQAGLSMDHWSADSDFNRMTVPYIRSSSKDEDILSLLQNNEDGEFILSRANLFELVAENYIEHYPCLLYTSRANPSAA